MSARTVFCNLWRCPSTRVPVQERQPPQKLVSTHVIVNSPASQSAPAVSGLSGLGLPARCTLVARTIIGVSISTPTTVHIRSRSRTSFTSPVFVRRVLRVILLYAMASRWP